MIKKYFFNILYYVLICTLLIVCSKIISSKIDITSETQTNYEQGGLTEGKKEQQKIEIPTEEEIQELEESYKTYYYYFEEIQSSKDNIESLYDEVTSAEVCSDANRYFNSLEKEYNTYSKKVSEVQIYISAYEEKYNDYVEMLSKIPEFSAYLHNSKYNEFEEKIEPIYIMICERKQNMSEEKVNVIFRDAKRIADELYDEYLEPMSHIGYAEAGNCPLIEICYVENVIENRIKSSKYPNTLLGVINEPGQYEPVITGSINREPSEYVKEVTAKYLRGKIVTGMPENVVFQSRNKQGTVWKYMESGHYFGY